MTRKMPVLAAHNLALSLGESYLILRHAGVHDSQIQFEIQDVGKSFPEVYQQSPEAGTSLASNTPVKIVLNAGARIDFTPDLFIQSVAQPLVLGNDTDRKHALSLLKELFDELIHSLGSSTEKWEESYAHFVDSWEKRHACSFTTISHDLDYHLPSADDLKGLEHLVMEIADRDFLHLLFAHLPSEIKNQYCNLPLMRYYRAIQGYTMSAEEKTHFFLQVARLHALQQESHEGVKLSYWSERLALPHELAETALSALSTFRETPFTADKFAHFVQTHLDCPLWVVPSSTQKCVTYSYPIPETSPETIRLIHRIAEVLTPLTIDIHFESRTEYLTLDHLGQGELDGCLLG